MDEATSSLDAETENKIQQALSILIKNRTAVVIAHRLSTILNSDSIYVINNGKVIETGTHSELLSNSEIYKGFYQKQIRKKLMLLLYRILINLTLLVSPLIIIFRILKKKKNILTRFLEKFGFFNKKKKPGKLIWFHGSSVGEILSVMPLIENLEKKKYKTNTFNLKYFKFFKSI